MYHKLRKYIDHGNDKMIKIRMTTPVLLQVEEKSNKLSFVMYFYVPRKFQESIPIPIDPTVSIVKKGIRVYVRTFSGKVEGYSTYKHQMEMLKNDLQKDGLKGTFKTNFFFYAVYDSPRRISGRHNEVWLRKI